jgi:hypothetical protein
MTMAKTQSAQLCSEDIDQLIEFTEADLAAALENSGYGELTYDYMKYLKVNDKNQAVFLVVFPSEQKEDEWEHGFIFLEKRNGQWYAEF